jgi:predicted RNA-binding protein with PUA-like domain
MNWLFKEEPEKYSFDSLLADRRTVWSGVRNPLAQKHLHMVKKGDRIFYYHTGKERSVVGVAKALNDAYPDPSDQSGRSAIVDVGPVKKLARPVTLAEIKADAAFKDFALVRIGRLSVMPVTDEQWERIEDMAAGG